MSPMCSGIARAPSAWILGASWLKIEGRRFWALAERIGFSMTCSTSSELSKILVRTFYRFTETPAERLPELRTQLFDFGTELRLRGSLLLSTEGCNGTVAGESDSVGALYERLLRDFPDMGCQDSWTESMPFRRWKVQIREQIVAARDPSLRPPANYEDQKNPEEWDQIRTMARQGLAQMLDVRNDYEVERGTFPEARDPNTETFKQFSDFLDREVGVSLDPKKPTAIFCTGGIRCEKARAELEGRGFETVWQLEGGVLRYLKERPNGGFVGSCFVFDERREVSAPEDFSPSDLKADRSQTESTRSTQEY